MRASAQQISWLSEQALLFLRDNEFARKITAAATRLVADATPIVMERKAHGSRLAWGKPMINTLDTSHSQQDPSRTSLGVPYWPALKNAVGSVNAALVMTYLEMKYPSPLP
jgi:hypothetical protein